MYTRSLASLLLVVLVSAALGFQQQPLPARKASTTAVNGIFDSIVKSMESGYAGGDDSPYAKIKEQDRLKEEIRQKKANERRKRGYKELKDVKERTFVKLKYDGADEPEEPKEEKKFFGLF